MGYYYVLPGSEPESFVFGDANMKVAECIGKRVQIGVPSILPDGGYTKEYIWVFVLSIDKAPGKGSILCGEALQPTLHKVPLNPDGMFAWVTRRDGVPKHTKVFKDTEVVKKTTLRFKPQDIVDVDMEAA